MKSKIRSSKSRVDVVPYFLMGARNVSIVCMALATLILIYSFFKPQGALSLRILAADALSPVLATLNQPFHNLSMTISGVSGMVEIKAENAKLKAENVRLKEWYQTALMLQAENQSLKKLLNFKVENTQNFTTSRVISDAGNTFVKTVLIASGANDGLQKNQAVLAGEGMVGRVAEVGKRSSRVLLVTDINSRIPILIEDTNQKAIMAGNNSNFPILKHLPQDTGGIAGKRVITSGHGGVFQPGLPIGRVIQNSSGDLAVQLYADINRVSLVRILDGSSDVNYISADSLETLP